MKKLLFIALITGFIGTVQAQNIQFLTDGMKSIGTFEIYKTLEHGALYYFTDFKINKNGYSEAYSEISKYWTIGKSSWSVTAQYNAGVSLNDYKTNNTGFHIYPVYLGGVEKAFSIGKNFNIAIDVLYRYQNYLYGIYLNNGMHKELHNGFQITPIFSENLNKFQISGYCDVWPNQTGFYYIFEPQAWWKFSKRVYVGFEWRNSNYADVLNTDINGIYAGHFANYLMLGFKWNLEN